MSPWHSRSWLPATQSYFPGFLITMNFTTSNPLIGEKNKKDENIWRRDRERQLVPSKDQPCSRRMTRPLQTIPKPGKEITRDEKGDSASARTQTYITAVPDFIHSFAHSSLILTRVFPHFPWLNSLARPATTTTPCPCWSPSSLSLSLLSPQFSSPALCHHLTRPLHPRTPSTPAP